MPEDDSRFRVTSDKVWQVLYGVNEKLVIEGTFRKSSIKLPLMGVKELS